MALETFVWKNYQLDVLTGDVTSTFFLDEKARKKVVTATITAKEEGILAGMQEAKWFLKKVGIRLISPMKEGAWLKKGDVVMQLKGKAADLLAAERTLLNLLQRLSGIATKTKMLASTLPPHITLLATRKTQWGVLDKRAVAVGGGGTHRLGLFDAILVKENHIALTSDFEKSLLSIFRHSKRVRFVEVELETKTEVSNFLSIFESFKKAHPALTKNIIVMLDDFKPTDIKAVLPALKKAGLLVEASGGINEKTIARYCLPGLDALSSSSITMAAKHLDLSMRVEG